MKTHPKPCLYPHLEKLLTHYNSVGWQHCDRGTTAALRSYIQTVELGLHTFVVRSMPFPGDRPLFMETLAEAGVTEFLLCEQSTALMEDLHFLLAEGWQISGPYGISPLLGLRMRKE